MMTSLPRQFTFAFMFNIAFVSDVDAGAGLVRDLVEGAARDRRRLLAVRVGVRQVVVCEVGGVAPRGQVVEDELLEVFELFSEFGDVILIAGRLPRARLPPERQQQKQKQHPVGAQDSSGVAQRRRSRGYAQICLDGQRERQMDSQRASSPLQFPIPTLKARHRPGVKGLRRA